MIKCKKGVVTLKGGAEEIHADLCCIFDDLKRKGIIEDVNDVTRLYGYTEMSHEQLIEEMRELLDEILEELEK